MRAQTLKKIVKHICEKYGEDFEFEMHNEQGELVDPVFWARFRIGESGEPEQYGILIAPDTNCVDVDYLELVKPSGADYGNERDNSDRQGDSGEDPDQSA